jgi:exopolysaccharide biosynthesis protein
MTELKSWMRENSALIYFLIAQFIAIGAGSASILAYMVKLETRVSTMETRGAEYTVARMDEMKRRITVLEQGIAQNEKSIDRIVDTMTKKLNVNP